MHYHSRMRKNNKPETQPAQRIPFQVKAREDVRTKLQILAKANGLSLNDVATMCLALGLPRVERKLNEIHNPEPELAAA
jgi:hypothetical protein